MELQLSAVSATACSRRGFQSSQVEPVSYVIGMQESETVDEGTGREWHAAGESVPVTK
jgi:hypothetical protein